MVPIALVEHLLTCTQKKIDAGSKTVGKAGDALPPFKQHMIRQRVDRHGIISPLEPESELPGCNLPPSEVGVIKEGPVKKWMNAKQEWDTRYASAKRRVQKRNGTRLSTIRRWGSPTSIRSSWPKENRRRSQSREEATKLGNELMVSMGQ
jgi:hypothetical protein